MEGGDGPTVSYAGFWWRFLANFLDSLVLGAVQGALLFVLAPGVLDPVTGEMATGAQAGLVLLSLAYVFGFWLWRQATPGKLAVGTRIVDARTGGRPGPGQFGLRYLGYFLSALPLFLGFIWMAFDRRKQGWHDKIAGTVVLRRGGAEPVRFEAGPLPASPPVP